MKCQKCQIEFYPRIIIDGKLHTFYKRKFCLNCSPFGQHNTTDLSNPAPKSTIDKIPTLDFYELVKGSISRSEMLLKLKLRKSGESFKILNRRLKQENVNVSHFIQGGRVGAKGNNRLYSDDMVYCKNSCHGHIRSRAISDKIMEYKCKECGIVDIWNNKSIVLELDHINGDRYDNRKENLRWLCPNCHSQTSTFCAKRRS